MDVSRSKVAWTECSTEEPFVWICLRGVADTFFLSWGILNLTTILI